MTYSAEERDRIMAEARSLIEQAEAEPVYFVDQCEDPVEKWRREALEAEARWERSTDLRHQREQQIIQQNQNAWLSAALEADWEHRSDIIAQVIAEERKRYRKALKDAVDTLRAELKAEAKTVTPLRKGVA
jgi:cell shape-determining protein MreC